MATSTPEMPSELVSREHTTAMLLDIDESMPNKWAQHGVEAAPVSQLADKSSHSWQEQHPTIGQRRPPRFRPKLRESCNNCALSKVKCTKEQPICVRCEERDLDCHYSPSRRTGKRRVLPSAPTSATTPSITTPLSSPQPRESLMVDNYSSRMLFVRWMELNASKSTDELLASLPTFNAPVELSSFWPRGDVVCQDDNGALPRTNKDYFSEIMHPELFQQAVLDSSSSLAQVMDSYEAARITGSAESFDHAGNDTPMMDSSCMTHHSDEIFTQSFPTLPIMFPDYQVRHNDEVSQSEAGMSDGSATAITTSSEIGTLAKGVESRALLGHCIGRALALLERLHAPPSRYDSMVTTPSPADGAGLKRSYYIIGEPASVSYSMLLQGHEVSHILSTNKEVIADAYDMLQCPCPPNIQVAFTLTSVVSEVICRYVAVAEMRGHCQLPENGGQDEAKFSAQVVLGELHLVLRLIEKLASNFKMVQTDERNINLKRSVDSGHADSKKGISRVGAGDEKYADSEWMQQKSPSFSQPDSTPMFLEMEKFLRNQLRLLAKEATAVLRTF